MASEIWYEYTDVGNLSSFDLITTTTVPGSGTLTITIFEDVGDDDTGPSSVTDANGTTHNYENSDSVTLAGGNETNTLTGFDGGGSTNAYIIRVEQDVAAVSDDSPKFDELTFNPAGAGSVIRTDSSGVIETDSSGVIQTTS